MHVAADLLGEPEVAIRAEGQLRGHERVDWEAVAGGQRILAQCAARRDVPDLCRSHFGVRLSRLIWFLGEPEAAIRCSCGFDDAIGRVAWMPLEHWQSTPRGWMRPQRKQHHIDDEDTDRGDANRHSQDDPEGGACALPALVRRRQHVGVSLSSGYLGVGLERSTRRLGRSSQRVYAPCAYCLLSISGADLQVGHVHIYAIPRVKSPGAVYNDTGRNPTKPELLTDGYGLPEAVLRL